MSLSNSQTESSQKTSSPSFRIHLQKMVFSAMLIALGVTGSVLPFFTIPVGPSKIAPLQHLINVLGAVLLGPGYALANALAKLFKEIVAKMLE